MQMPAHAEKHKLQNTAKKQIIISAAFGRVTEAHNTCNIAHFAFTSQ